MYARVTAVSSRHIHLPIVRTLGALAVATTLTFLLGACSRDVTAPTDARPKAAEAKPAFSVSGSALWGGRTVSIESKQPNLAGQTVCLDIPSGNAFSGQDVNYYPCHYGASQQFMLSAWDAGFGESWVVMKPVSNSSVCLDIRGGTTNGGEHLQLYTCKPSGAGNQTFLLPEANYPSATGVPLVSTICVEAGHLALDVPLPAGVSGYVQQFLWNGGRNQLWRFKDISTGQYFTSVTSGISWNRC